MVRQATIAWILALSLGCLLTVALSAQNGAYGKTPGPSSVPSTPPEASPQDPVPTTLVSNPALGPMNRYEGARVTDVQLRGFSEDAKVVQHLRELVKQQTGEPLDRIKIRESLQALYATGRFSNIQVEAEKTPQNDVKLVFNARQNFFIGMVTVDGTPKRPRPTQLVNASKLQLGALFTPEGLERAVANMKSVLADNGYYKAEVRHTEQFRPEVQQVAIQFRIVPNQPARVGQIAVQGDAGFTPKQVRDISGVHTGDPVSADRITRALQRLRKKYQKQGRLEAQVSVVDRKYNPNENTVDYAFRIDRGPTVDIEVEGAKVRKGIVKKYVPAFEENAVDDDLLNEGRRNLRDYFQTKGFFNVAVDYEKKHDSTKDHLSVVYTIHKGPEQKLLGIQVNGNHYFDKDTIRERMGIKPASGFLTNGVFSQSQLTRDLESVENLYKANGFLDVKVKGEAQADYNGQKGTMVVVLDITEGTQTRVNSLKIIGNNTIKTPELENLVTTIAGQPFSAFNVATDRESVVTYYYNHGFPNIEFESASTPVANNPALMDVVFTIKEGDQVFVDRVLLSGLNFTRPYIVQREVQVHASDPVSQMGMLDSQRRLYDLGLFNEVNMAVQNPDGASKYKDVLFDMREARRWTFNYGFGFELQTGSQPLNSDQINTAPAPGIDVPPNTTPPQEGNLTTANPQGGTGVSPRVSFEVTRLNFRGRDHTLSFKTHLSTLSRRALASYDAPRWFDKDNLRLTVTALADNSRDVRTFSSERIEGAVQAEDVVSRVTSLLFRFQYRRVRVDPRTLVISPELVPLFSKPVRVGMPSFTYIRDKRDDPIDTHKGNYTTFDTGVAAGVFGSAANFGRLLAQNSTYVPIKRKFVLARSLRIGVAEPFGTGQEAIVPLPERFFAGGTQSHRGFALNQAGPRDLFTGFPLGGNAVLVNQVELRMPPLALPFAGDNLNFVLFHDFGNVFESGQDMVKSLFRWYQPRREACSSEVNHLQCDFNYISHAAGIGARYRTPIGPVRIDASYNFNPPAFPFYVQCPSTPPTGSNAGPCATLPPSALIFQSGTLRHFNFFFSIGQTF